MKRALIFIVFLSCFFANSFAVILGIDRGEVRLELNESNGAVLLYTRNLEITDESKQLAPVFAESNPTELSRYLLKVGPRAYELMPYRNALKVEAEETLFGISITYTITKVASVLLDFLFFSHIEGLQQDTVRIAVTVTNNSYKPDTFAFKGIFDTYMGENTTNHYSTMLEDNIRGERFFKNINEIKWIDSCNALLSMKLVLCDFDITVPPAWAAICTRSDAFNRFWEPPISNNAALTGFSANNNSAVAVAWENIDLEPEATSEYAFYITTAIRGKEAPSDLSQAFLGKLTNEKIPPRTRVFDAMPAVLPSKTIV